MAMIVCERVSGDITAFLLVSEELSLAWTRLAFQHSDWAWSLLNVLYGTKSFDNEISLAYLINLFYETGLEVLEVRRHIS